MHMHTHTHAQVDVCTGQRPVELHCADNIYIYIYNMCVRVRVCVRACARACGWVVGVRILFALHIAKRDREKEAATRRERQFKKEY